MADQYPGLFLIGVALFIVIVIFLLARRKPTAIQLLQAELKATEDEPLPIWDKPGGPDHMPEDVVRFMQHYKLCPFCHADLVAGPKGGYSQNFYCGDPDCNSRFNIVPLPPDHPRSVPLGEYLGPCPQDYLDDRRAQLLKRKVEHFMKETDYVDGHPVIPIKGRKEKGDP